MNYFLHCVQESMERVLSLYPQAAQLDSPFATALRAREASLKSSEPEYFEHADWPERLAALVASDFVEASMVRVIERYPDAAEAGSLFNTLLKAEEAQLLNSDSAEASALLMRLDWPEVLAERIAARFSGTEN